MENIGFPFDFEDIYGHGKRLHFIKKAIEDYCQKSQKKVSDISIFDVGCGTGIGITFPIASLGYKILGIDIDLSSIEKANKINIYPNASFFNGFIEEKADLKDIDIIICSEVLEHVPNPFKFLLSLKCCLKKEGIIILTTPNGYGWFEFEKFVYEKLGIKFLLKVLVDFKRVILPSKNFLPLATLNKEDRHLQRFTYKRLRLLFQEFGFSILKESGAGLFGGPISETFFGRCKLLLKFNNWLGDKVPSYLVIDWYFVLEKSSNN